MLITPYFDRPRSKEIGRSCGFVKRNGNYRKGDQKNATDEQWKPIST
jgi:hypothetical protein